MRAPRPVSEQTAAPTRRRRRTTRGAARPSSSPSARPRLCGAAAAFVCAAALASPAAAQGKLTAQYRISVAGISIGRGDFTAYISADHYTAAGAGRTSGFLRILVGGKGTVAAQGAVSNGRLIASTFSAMLDEVDERSTVTMSLDNGSVKELVAKTSAPVGDRIPLSDADRHGVIDPVSAMLVPDGAALSPAACQRTLPIFDGIRRYDLALSFKRMDNAKTDKGYRGPVVVCAVQLRPIAGHRADSALVKYLSDGRDLELWLAPIAGTGVLGPYRLSVANIIGSLAIEAERYESAAQPAAAQPPAETAARPSPLP